VVDISMTSEPNGASNSLFVGDLSKFCNEENLEQLFKRYGHVAEVKIKRNNTTGKTLSYGFVTFLTEESAALAMEHLNGYSFFGRNLRYWLHCRCMEYYLRYMSNLFEQDTPGRAQRESAKTGRRLGHQFRLRAFYHTEGENRAFYGKL
jgi:hypothetical protein